MTSPFNRQGQPLANSNAKKDNGRGAGGAVEEGQKRLPRRSQPCEETPPPKAALLALSSGTDHGEAEGPPRGPQGVPGQPPAGVVGAYSHSAWRGSSVSPRPPRWHPARSRRASSPTKRVAPPGGVTFSSQSGPGSLSRFPGHWVSRHPRLAHRCPGSPRPQVRPLGGGCPEGARAPCSGVAPPVGLPAPLPSRAPLLARAAAGAPRLVSRLSLPPGQSAFISFNTTGFLFVKFS